MQYRAHIKDGAIVLDEQVQWPEGTALLVEPVTAPVAQKRSLAERLSGVIGQATTLPPDGAQQHDHYLYGQPKT